jgi:hypothetical protein
MCAPVASRARARDQDRKVSVREHQHPRAEAVRQVQGQRLLPVRAAADRRAEQAAGPGLGRDPPRLRERAKPKQDEKAHWICGRFTTSMPWGSRMNYPEHAAPESIGRFHCCPR